jgi:hypothetical protein
MATLSGTLEPVLGDNAGVVIVHPAGKTMPEGLACQQARVPAQ